MKEKVVSVSFTDGRIRKVIWLLCVLAAVHVFIFSTIFPFFNNVDEVNHFDVVMKYALGGPPAKMRPISAEAMRYVAVFGTQEYLWPTNFFPAGQYPLPPWMQSVDEINRYISVNESRRESIINYEDSQPPFYYGLAGLWLRLGQCFGFEGGRLLYWIRFLNILIVPMIVYVAYLIAQKVFPENIFIKLCVPALLAFMPQPTFYSIENDVLSPLCFGMAFLLILIFFEADNSSIRLGAAIGFALAATYLTKISNLPLIGTAIAAVLFKTQKHSFRQLLPSLVAILSASVPIVLWMLWSKFVFGDFTGSSAKIKILHWTVKPLNEWLRHPIFTPDGFWIFLSGNLETLWQGEIWWHHAPLARPAFNLVYAIVSIVMVVLALRILLPSADAARQQRHSMFFASVTVVASFAFFGLLSIIYDFHDCSYPSPDYPYFTSGRLLLGTLIPFLLLFTFGLDYALKKFNNIVKFAVLSVLILFMLISEIITDWPVFQSQYNWYHM